MRLIFSEGKIISHTLFLYQYMNSQMDKTGEHFLGLQCQDSKRETSKAKNMLLSLLKILKIYY